MAAQSVHLNWFNPVRITLGLDCVGHIAAQLTAGQNVVVLADRAALDVELEALLRDRLGRACRGWGWFEGGLASVFRVQALGEQLWPVMQQYPDALVLAIGGGSTLDLAKVLRYRFATLKTPAALPIDHWRANTLPVGSGSNAAYFRHPLWLVPTTSGTGSEVTRWATLWDTDSQPATKLSWAPADGFAERAWVDPRLTVSCPPRVTRDCALDTLAHALESIWNHHANVATVALALPAARSVLAALPLVMDKPDHLPARDALSRASLMAGLAMSQTQTALAHALSYNLTLREGVPHGEACAVWLPMVWELAMGHSTLCDTALAQIFDAGTGGANSLREWLQNLNVGMRDLRDTSAGQITLHNEMQSARGRNFIAAKH
jgi:phosphonate metabolism-associated iron-containing alcohol dehydrogenase